MKKKLLKLALLSAVAFTFALKDGQAGYLICPNNTSHCSDAFNCYCPPDQAPACRGGCCTCLS